MERKDQRLTSDPSLYAIRCVSRSIANCRRLPGDSSSEHEASDGRQMQHVFQLGANRALAIHVGRCVVWQARSLAVMSVSFGLGSSRSGNLRSP
eukprot:2061502-Amphidinium_carterae.1